MIGAASFSPAHRRMRDSGVLVVLIWVTFHLMGCVHSHGPAFDSPHYPMSTAYAAAAPVAALGGGPTASAPERAPCCPDTGDHTMDRVRSDAPPVPSPGGAPTVHALPCGPDAALAGAGSARAPGDGALGGRGVLTALCVART
ncbi:hypothetical protein OOK13_41855 [Streptomyces sp. NBC_00378]|uniref:hypothetical protein n=1 Tax=unclassified Streptomyces TaxID=2593676 RepID=UPI00224E2796|nr:MULTISPECIES: hypothetical protein [unclassified Streptomyces]MCX5114880.1 hypothetical protein [Streptomyces sp. NBC_00378]